MLDLSTTDSPTRPARQPSACSRAKNPVLVQAVLTAWAPSGEEMPTTAGVAAPAGAVEQGRHRPSERREHAVLARARLRWRGRLRTASAGCWRGAGRTLAEADLLDLPAGVPVGDAVAAWPARSRSIVCSPALYSIASSPKAHPREVHPPSRRCAGQQRAAAHRHRLVLPRRLRQARRRGCRCSCRRATASDPRSTTTRRRYHGRPGTGIAPVPRLPRGARRRGERRAQLVVLRRPEARERLLYEGSGCRLATARRAHPPELAWSRDQAEKIYVQQRMRENAAGSGSGWRAGTWPRLR